MLKRTLTRALSLVLALLVLLPALPALAAGGNDLPPASSLVEEQPPAGDAPGGEDDSTPPENEDPADGTPAGEGEINAGDEAPEAEVLGDVVSADRGWYTTDPTAATFAIGTYEELLSLFTLVREQSFEGKTITLTADIDMTGKDNDEDDANGNWQAIGDYSYPFRGTFDGDGHIIKGLSVKGHLPWGDDAGGLFGYVWGGTVRNLGLVGVDIDCSRDSAGLVANLYDGMVENCFVTGSVRAYNVPSEDPQYEGDGTYPEAGGLVASCIGSTIRNSFTNVAVDGYACAGGLVSFASLDANFGPGPALIENCYALGTVAARDKHTNGFAAGMVTWAQTGSTVQNTIALCESIAADYDQNHVARISFPMSYDDTFGVLANNYAWEGHICSYADANGRDGDDLTASQLMDLATWQTRFGEDNTAWAWAGWDPASPAPPMLAAFAARADLADFAPQFPQELVNDVSGTVTPDDAWYTANPNATTFEISTYAELVALANLVNTGVSFKGKTITLTSDITIGDDADTDGSRLNGNLEPIGGLVKATTVNGESRTDFYYFNGTFDGGGHVIKNLAVVVRGIPSLDRYFDGAGLFGSLEGKVKNLGLVNADIRGYYNTGGIAGVVQKGGAVENCFVAGTVGYAPNLAYGSVVGGIAGTVQGTVKNCYSASDVTTSSIGGGIVGHAYDTAKVTSNYTSGSVVLENARDQWFRVGGIVGFAGTDSVFGTNSKATVTNNVAAGPLVALASYRNATQTGDYSKIISRITGHTITLISAGWTYNAATLAKNYAWNRLERSIPAGGTLPALKNTATGVDGADASTGSLLSTAFWQGAGFTDTVWDMAPGRLPVLKGFDGGDQAALAAPDHLSQGVIGVNAPNTDWYNAQKTTHTLYTYPQLLGLAQLVSEGNDFSGHTITLGEDLFILPGMDCDADDTNGNWTPVGSPSGTGFAGTFDGGGNTITGLSVKGAELGGLFAYVRGGTVKNLGLEDADIVAGKHAGGVVANLYGGTVSGCYTTGTVAVSVAAAGTIVNPAAGGVVGAILPAAATVTNCASYADVTVTTPDGDGKAGGVVGILASHTTLENAFATGAVAANGYAGGVVGYAINSASAPPTIKNVAALNESSAIDTTRTGRVVGTTQNTVTLANLNSWDKMPGKWVNHPAAVNSATGQNGADRTAAWLKKAASWKTVLGASTAWTYADGALPVLKAFGGKQPKAFPDHVTETWKAPAGVSGSGTTASPFLIGTAAQLRALSSMADQGYGYTGAIFKQTEHIDLEDTAFAPIGGADAMFFGGTYNGNHKVVKGLKVATTEIGPAGLFGHLKGGTVKDLGVLGADVASPAGTLGYAGILAGYVDKGAAISGCFTQGTVHGVYAGGLAGYVDGATISDSYARATVTFERIDDINFGSGGGLVGYATGGQHGSPATTIQRNYTAGTVAAVGAGGYLSSAGGLVGFAESLTLQNNVVLVSSIDITGEYTMMGRVANTAVPDGLTLKNNYAFEGMVLNGQPFSVYDPAGTSSASTKNGAGVSKIQIRKASFWGGLTFTGANGWAVADGSLPARKAFGADAAQPNAIDGALAPDYSAQAFTFTASPAQLPYKTTAQAVTFTLEETGGEGWVDGDFELTVDGIDAKNLGAMAMASDTRATWKLTVPAKYTGLITLTLTPKHNGTSPTPQVVKVGDAVDSISLNDLILATGTLATGMELTVLPATAGNRLCTWKLYELDTAGQSDPWAATMEHDGSVATIAADGTLTAVANGQVVAEAVSIDNPAAKARSVVTVCPPVDTDASTFKSGAAVLALKAGTQRLPNSVNGGNVPWQLLPANAQLRNFSVESSNSGVLEVERYERDDLEVTAKALGTAVLTVSYTDGTGITQTALITVKVVADPGNLAIALKSPPKVLNAGKTASLKYTLTPANASLESLNWTIEGSLADGASPTEPVLSVDHNGKVTALHPGKATVRVTATDLLGNDQQDAVEITVRHPASALDVTAVSNGGWFTEYSAAKKTLYLAANLYAAQADVFTSYTLIPAQAPTRGMAGQPNDQVSWTTSEDAKDPTDRLLTVTDSGNGSIEVAANSAGGALRTGKVTLKATARGPAGTSGTKTATVTIAVGVPLAADDGSAYAAAAKAYTPNMKVNEAQRFEFALPQNAGQTPTDVTAAWAVSRPAYGSIKRYNATSATFKALAPTAAGDKATVTLGSPYSRATVTLDYTPTVIAPITHLAFSQTDFTVAPGDGSASGFGVYLVANQGGALSHGLGTNVQGFDLSATDKVTLSVPDDAPFFLVDPVDFSDKTRLELAIEADSRLHLTVRPKAGAELNGCTASALITAESTAVTYAQGKSAAKKTATLKITVSDSFTPVTGLTPTGTDFTVDLRKTFTPPVTVQPADATNKQVLYTIRAEYTDATPGTPEWAEYVTFNPANGKTTGIKVTPANVRIVLDYTSVDRTNSLAVQQLNLAVTQKATRAAIEWQGTPGLKAATLPAPLANGSNAADTLASAQAVLTSATNTTVTWTSSNSSVLAIVGGAGGGEQLVTDQPISVRAMKPGTVTLKAVAADGSKKNASIRVKVAQPAEDVAILDTGADAPGGTVPSIWIDAGKARTLKGKQNAETEATLVNGGPKAKYPAAAGKLQWVILEQYEYNTAGMAQLTTTPVVTLNPATGAVKGLRDGYALIRALPADIDLADILAVKACAYTDVPVITSAKAGLLYYGNTVKVEVNAKAAKVALAEKAFAIYSGPGGRSFVLNAATTPGLEALTDQPDARSGSLTWSIPYNKAAPEAEVLSFSGIGRDSTVKNEKTKTQSVTTSPAGGSFITLRARALAPGESVKCTVKVTTASGKSASVAVTVTGSPAKAPAVEDMTLTPDSAWLAPGKSLKLKTALAASANGKAARAGNQNLYWSITEYAAGDTAGTTPLTGSSAGTVATIDQTGKVTARGLGWAKVTVRAMDGGQTETCTVYIVAKP